VSRLEEFAPELVVVGGGMGGISCAMRARHLGARVAVIEPEALGGT
jgi:pyruvate/2-oxoglutarate dehydrogenase complex dihydrolipoamide dehydrogenase (E3) component